MGHFMIIILYTFSSLSHDLLIGELYTNGFAITDSKLIRHYLTNIKQCVKIDCTFSSEK